MLSALHAWVAFCQVWNCDVVLWGKGGGRPSGKVVLEAEWKLLLFCVWLHNSGYAAATCSGYVGSVDSWHGKITGLPAQAVGVVFYRLPMLFRTLKKLNPAKLRDKRPWEFSYSLAVLEGWKQNGELSFAGDKDPYLMMVAWEVIKLAFEQLMRLAELVTTKPASVSMRNPLKWCDVTYEDAQGEVLGYDEEGRPMGCPVRARLREPPSKMRGGGGVLTLPFPRGWYPGMETLASGPGLFMMQTQHPVPREQAKKVPLFGMTEWSPDRRFVVQISQQKFMTAMHRLCNGAVPVVRYDSKEGKLGLHAWRVGGTNRLIDLGASAPQVCAAGRWMGDCWVLYARRQRAVLEELTVRMSQKEGQKDSPW